MEKYRMVGTDFWKDPVVLEEMTPEESYFYLYLLTNPRITQIGIYKIMKKEMAFDLGYSIESVQSLMDRFISHHQLFRYNTDTRELAIKNRGRVNLRKGGKFMMDCILSELREVEDASIISYVAENTAKGPILAIYESFCEKNEAPVLNDEKEIFYDNDTYIDPELPKGDELCNDRSPTRDTIRGQTEREEKKIRRLLK
ncbi:hypothetical protein ACLM5H_16835 [Fredinandcohnia humi]